MHRDGRHISRGKKRAIEIRRQDVQNAEEKLEVDSVLEAERRRYPVLRPDYLKSAELCRLEKVSASARHLVTASY
jgi:hypothetical protein